MEQVELLQYTIRVLDRIEIPYALVGSFASAIWGEVRFTQDIDIVLDLRNDQIESLFSGLLNRLKLPVSGKRYWTSWNRGVKRVSLVPWYPGTTANIPHCQRGPNLGYWPVWQRERRFQHGRLDPRFTGAGIRRDLLLEEILISSGRGAVW